MADRSGTLSRNRSVALMTASWRGDFERCKLLCRSVDTFVASAHHYLLVADDDAALFSSLAGARRSIVTESDLLPSWLHAISAARWNGGRNIWLSRRTWPMRGWHTQQLRRIALAQHVDEDGLLSFDSDMLFVRPFDPGDLWQGDDLRLYRWPDAITEAELPEHVGWCAGAARLLGQPAPVLPAADFINNLVSWRAGDVRDMCARIEEHTGRHWVEAIGRYRTFSECQIYGAYVDGQGGRGHWPTEHSLCRTYWKGVPLSIDSLRRFVEDMDDEQVSIGVQSFIDTPIAMLENLLASVENSPVGHARR